VCYPRHPIYIFLSLEIMLRVPTALRLSVADDITRQSANYDGNYNFFVYPYSILQEFEVDREVIMTS